MNEIQETSQEIQLRWEKLQKEKREIAEMIDVLRQKISDRNKNDEILLLRQKMEELQEVIKDIFDSIRLREKNIENRKKVVREKKMKELVKKFQGRTRKVGCLLSDDYKKGNIVFQSSIMPNRRYREALSEEFLPSITLPEDQCINEENMQDEEAISSLKGFLEKSKSDIVRVKAKIKEKCDEAEKLLRHKLAEKKEETQKCNLKILNWAVGNRCRLRWVADNGLLPKEEVIGLYKKEHPSEDVSDLSFNPQLFLRLPQFSPKRRKKRMKNFSSSVVLTENGANQKNWKFFVVFFQNERGKELPSNHDEFSSCLKGILGEANYRGVVNTQLAHEKLVSLTKATLHQRRAIKEVFKGTQFIGWKIINVSKKHRLFCDIDEKNNYIRFTIVPRKEAYYGNH